MSPTVVATIAGLITAVAWGVGDWLQARTTRHNGVLETYNAVNVYALIMYSLILWLTNGSAALHGHGAEVVAAGLLIGTGYYAFLNALSRGSIGIVVPLGNTFPLLVIILSAIFLDQVFGSWEVAAMIAIIAGASALAYEKNHDKIPLKELHRDTILTLVAVVCWGIGFTIINNLLGVVSWQALLVYTTIVETILGMLLMATRGSASVKSFKRAVTDRRVLITGIIANTGVVALYFGGDYAGSIVVPAVVSSCAPLVASALGAVYDHEKIGFMKRVGAVAVVAGVILLNLSE